MRFASSLFSLIACAACSRTAGDAIEATGTLEQVEIRVAPTMVARVKRVFVDEGATVLAGDTLVLLTVATLAADVRQREARSASAGALLKEAQHGARSADVRRAEAELAAVQADADRASRDVERLRGLAERGVVSTQQYDAARSLATSSAARRDALMASLSLLREGTRPERLQATNADAQAARAAVDAARASAADLVLLAPLSGTVTIRAVEPGEVIGAGQAALTVASTKRQTVRVFVSQAALPRVQVGQRVHGALDALPGREFQGRVVALSTAAEFTPRVALTESERADLLFGVKVEFADSTGMLKAGLPITVRIDAPPSGGAAPATTSVPAKASSPSRP